MPLDPTLVHIIKSNPLGAIGDDLESLHAARAEARKISLAHPSSIKVRRTEDRQIPGTEGDVGIRIYWPQTASTQGDKTRDLPLVVFYHGGGFALGDLETYDDAARAISAEAEAIVISVDYRLAPEHPYPAAAHDAFDALNWAYAHADELGANPARFAVAGNSAGGNLAAVVAQLARDAGAPTLKFQLLWYPATTFDLSLPSVAENADGPLLTLASLRIFYKYYLGTAVDGDPKTLPATAAPALGKLDGLPPAYIGTAQYDPLRDDGGLYAKLLAEAGVPVERHNAETLTHGYLAYASLVPAAKAAREQAIAALKAAL